MGQLLSRFGRRNWNCRCCNPWTPDHGRLRRIEDNFWREDWAEEIADLEQAD